jgi:hypothetical protein
MLQENLSIGKDLWNTAMLDGVLEQFNERFKQYYLKRTKDGLPYEMAVLATLQLISSSG